MYFNFSWLVSRVHYLIFVVMLLFVVNAFATSPPKEGQEDLAAEVPFPYSGDFDGPKLPCALWYEQDGELLIKLEEQKGSARNEYLVKVMNPDSGVIAHGVLRPKGLLYAGEVYSKKKRVPVVIARGQMIGEAAIGPGRADEYFVRVGAEWKPLRPVIVDGGR